jgi:uncharacterized protein YjdB
MTAMKYVVRAQLPLALVVLFACGDELGPPVPAAIVVTPEVPRVLTGGTVQLTAVVVDAAGDEISGHPVTFRSSDPTVLAVDGDGLLASPGPVGSSTITATSGDISAEVEAVVVLPPSALVVSPASLELDTGELQALSVTVTDENGEPVPEAEFSLESDNPAIATVGQEFGSGLVTGLAVGSATVTVTSGGRTAEVPVTVARIPSSVAITPVDLVLEPGGSQQLTAALLDRTGEVIDLPQSFAWSSSDEAVVTVSQGGLVTSAGPEGTAVVTATTDTFTASLGVFVGTAPAGEIVSRLPLSAADGVAVTSDGRYFVTSFDTLVGGALPDFAFPVQVPLIGNTNDVVLNATVTRAYVAGAWNDAFGEGVGVVDLTTNSLIDFIPVRQSRPSAAALSDDGSVLTIGTNRGFEVIDVASKTSLGGTTVGHVNKVTRHPSRPLLYASSESGVLELDPESGDILRRFSQNSWGHVVTPDGTRLYAVSFLGEVTVWNLDTGVQERSLPGVRGTDLTISPDGRFLYVLLGSDFTVGGSKLRIVDPTSGIVLRTVDLGGLARRIAMLPDGTAIISNYGGDVGWVDFVR